MVWRATEVEAATSLFSLTSSVDEDEGRVVVVGIGAVKAVSESIKEEIEFGSKEADEEAVAESSVAVAESSVSLEVALRL